jgi:hypothetical protein
MAMWDENAKPWENVERDQCTKCGRRIQTKVRYCLGTNRTLFCRGPEQEHLHVICPECGYEFITPCYDATSA